VSLISESSFEEKEEHATASQQGMYKLDMHVLAAYVYTIFLKFPLYMYMW